MFHAAVNLWSAESDICQKQRKWRWTTVGSALCGSATVPTRSVQAASSSAEVSYVGLGRVSVPRPTMVYQVIRLGTRLRDAQDIALRSWETRRQPWCLCTATRRRRLPSVRLTPCGPYEFQRLQAECIRYTTSRVKTQAHRVKSRTLLHFPIASLALDTQ